MEKMNKTSLNLTKSNVDKLKEFFPNVVTEGKIDFDMLRTMLGDEVDDSKEKYQFAWNGKSEAIKVAQSPSTATLRPDKESSKNWDTTENLYIEGDNLEVLKQLQKTYYGKIKMIYIDPPYNTGKDFIYHDDYRKSLENYKEQTNQINKSNPETSGRFHTDWLNMIYPRLILAKNLLSEDGVIYISIDDRENYNLRKICDEIFGDTNYIQEIIWQKKFSPQNDSQYFSLNHESLLCYAKHKDKFNRNLLPMTNEQKNRYKNYDNDKRGPWISSDLTVPRYTPKDNYPVTSPSGKVFFPSHGRSWKTSQENMNALIEDNRIWFGEKGDHMPRLKNFMSETNQGMVPISLWTYDEVGHTQSASQDLKQLFDNKQYFDYPKPIEYIKRMIRIGTNENDIILDFFSGSGTTAHSVFSINNEEKSKRRFILVQLPERLPEKSLAYNDGYTDICQIGEERIRRAGEQIKAEWEKEHPQDTLLTSEEKFTTDIGFKVFKLDSTNIRPWDSEFEMSSDDLFSLSDVFKQDRSKEDILYEIMLKYGIFDMPAEEVEINGKTMYRVGKRYMIVCLEDEITSEDVKAIAELSPRSVVFKESGFKNDNDKINAEYNLEKADVEDVKCI